MEKQLPVPSKFVTVISGVLILLGLYLTSLYSYLLFHSLAEMFSIVVACGIFMLAWNSRRFLDNNYLLFIGIAYLFIGGLDLVHTLAYRGMNVFQGYETNLPTQLWIAGRYMESLSLLIAPLVLGRKLKINVVFIAYTAGVFFVLASIFYLQIFPVCFIEGVGLTPFKKTSEYVISLILLAAVFLLAQKRNKFDPNAFQLLVASIIVTIGSELAFTFYVHPYGLSNLIGHYFKIISFYLIYKAMIEIGLVTPYNLLFRNLKQSEETLKKARDELEFRVKERTADLTNATEELRMEITEHKRAVEALRMSQEYGKAIINSSLDMIITVDTDRHIIEFNRAAEENFGYRHEEVVGTSIETLYANPQEALAIHKTTVEQGKCVQEILNRRKNGEVFPSFLSASLLRDGAGEVLGVMGVSRDITARKQAEEKIQASLKEKEVLLREIHHRVKNNLQVISSLLDMRIMRTDNHQVIDMFEDTRSKIHTMALIHTRLYRSERFDRIDMGSHIRELVDYLSQIYEKSATLISPIIDVSGVFFSVTQAIPCALVINELVSNAFKHAFKGREKGTVKISLKRTADDMAILIVKDNGIGVPEEIDILKTNSLGFKLLRNTVQDQLMGKIHIEQGVGATIIVEFKISE
jgi:PAS domain S-box-containing protein